MWQIFIVSPIFLHVRDINDGQLLRYSRYSVNKVGTQTFLLYYLQGRAHHNVLNVLATVAALVAQGDCSSADIVKGIHSFIPSVEKNPLRLNVLNINGVTVLHDYAHNLAAYRSILATAHAMKCSRIVGVITAPGDRRDADLKELATLCAQEGEKGAMFGVFNAYELQIIYDWIAGARPQVPTSMNRRYRNRRQSPESTSQDICEGKAYSDEFSAESDLLTDKLAHAPDKNAFMDLLVPWLSPIYHHTPLGLIATRIFTQRLRA